MKKILLILAIAVLCIALCACADGGNVDDTDGAVTDSPAETDNIIDDILDPDDNGGNTNGGNNNGDNNGGSGDTVPTSIPGGNDANGGDTNTNGNAPEVTQPVTP